MGIITFTTVLAGINVISQTVVASSDSFGGVSGQESIMRACVAPLDASTGLLYLGGLLNFITEPNEGSAIRISRWSLLHSNEWNRSKSLKISVRTSWLSAFETSTRIAKVRWKSPAFEQPSRIKFPQNLSSFIVPYMQRRVSKPERYQLGLSPSAVENAAGHSIARFWILLSWSLVIFILRTSLLWFHTSSWWQNAIILTSEFGRLAMTIFQELSIITYSCQYKGISTWATPPSARTGQCWSDTKQKQFQKAVLNEIGRNYLAKWLFLGLERVWPWVFPLSSWIFSPENVGRTMFANFCSPPADSFLEGSDLIVAVHEERPGCDEKHLYSITFQKAPTIMVKMMQSYLTPTPTERWLFGYSMLFPALAGIIAPVIFALAHPSALAQIYWLVEQSVVNLVKYYDFCEVSINSKFDAPLDMIGDVNESA